MNRSVHEGLCDPTVSSTLSRRCGPELERVAGGLLAKAGLKGERGLATWRPF